ncbi:hypothetical protein Taro_033923, partial [Colocasia esculenta]|nr:hypothetical protein [Colocasia esculenta]
MVDGSSWKDLGARGRVRSGGKQQIGWRFSRGSFWGFGANRGLARLLTRFGDLLWLQGGVV